MPKHLELVFKPGPKGKRGRLIIRGGGGATILQVPVKSTFDPRTIYLDPYCCDNSFGNCRARKGGENCADGDKPITVWKLQAKI